MIDTETGQTPPTAAERMDAHDRKLGIEQVRPARLGGTSTISAKARAESGLPESGLSARPAPSAEPKRRPWASAATPTGQPAAKSDTMRSARRPVPQSPVPQSKDGPKNIVTGKWWDAKGPRKIALGPKGQQVLNGGFVTMFAVAAIITVALLILQPVLMFVGAFLLFRFGGAIIGPFGAALIDKALAERN